MLICGPTLICEPANKLILANKRVLANKIILANKLILANKDIDLCLVMSVNDNISLPMVPALPHMFIADVERPEKKRSAPADNEDEAAKPQKKKHPTAKQISSKILSEN